MTVDAILQSVHASYQGDTSYPVSGDEDYTLRISFVRDAINTWATRSSEENTEWKELFTTLTAAADGDKTATATDYSYDMPTNFDHLTSKVTITNADNAVLYYDVITPDKVQEYERNDPNGRWCYVTGNEADGYDLHIPAPIAGTIKYNYYKTPTLPTLGSQTPEMKRPYFIVHDVLSKLFELDGRNDLVTFHEAKKKGIMDSMVIDNELVPFGNSSTLDDLQGNDGVSWGQ